MTGRYSAIPECISSYPGGWVRKGIKHASHPDIINCLKRSHGHLASVIAMIVRPPRQVDRHQHRARYQGCRPEVRWVFVQARSFVATWL